jgi:hypothetical protein
MAGFDPKAFLQKTAPAAEPTPPPAPQVGAAETFALRGSQALPAGGLVADLLSTGAFLALKPKPGAVIPEAARKELATMGIAVEEPQETGVLDTYRGMRDTRRLRTAAGSEQNPGAARAGTALGIAASIAAPLPKTSFGAVKDANGVLQMDRATRVGNAALTGGLYGAFNGAVDGPADLTRGDVAGAAEDTVDGAVLGTLLGGTFGLAAEGVRPVAGKLREFAIKQAKKTTQGGSDIAAATRKPMSDEAAEEVLQSGAIRPFSTTQATAERIEKLAAERGAVYGKILEELEQQGVQGPNAKVLADQIYQRYLQEYPNFVDSKAIPEIFKRVAENVDEVARPGPVGVVSGPPREALGLQQTERLKQEMQNLAKHHKLNASPAEDAYKELGSTFRKVNEDAISTAAQAAPAGSRLRQLGESFKPVKEQLARTLEARHFARPGASKAEQRSAVGLKDYVLGAAAGDPGAAAGTALLSSVARNRLPSTLASGSWNLSEGLRTGSLSSDVAATLAGSADLAEEEARSRADRATIDPTTDPITAALIRALRTRKAKPTPRRSDAP